MLPTEEVHMLRSLKKTAIVLLLMLRLDRPISRNQIAAILDIHVQTARDYLRQLSAANIVAHTNQGWILTQAGSQWVLPIIDAGKSPPKLINNINRYEKNKNSEVNINRGGDIPTPHTSDIWRLFLSYGIDRNPRVEKIVNKPFFTSEYLRAHVDALDRKGYQMPQWAGMLILQLETGIDPGHADGCQCEKCQNYTGGEYSEFIQS